MTHITRENMRVYDSRGVEWNFPSFFFQRIRVSEEVAAAQHWLFWLHILISLDDSQLCFGGILSATEGTDWAQVDDVYESAVHCKTLYDFCIWIRINIREDSAVCGAQVKVKKKKKDPISSGVGNRENQGKNSIAACLTHASKCIHGTKKTPTQQ